MRGLEKIKELIHMSEIPNRTLKSGLFGNYQGYMNYKQYYYDQTNKLPNGYSINNIRISYENFFKIVKKEDIIVTSDHNKNENQELFFKYKDLFINTSGNFHLHNKEYFFGYFMFYYDLGHKNQIDEFLEQFKDCDQYGTFKKSGTLRLVTQDKGGLDTVIFNIKNDQHDVSKNYNNDLQDINKIILERLNKQTDKGIVLLHGKPGTGKTSYIRYLINNIENKDIIYLPPDLANSISDPSFIPFIMDYTNSVLIIEDSENVIQKRQGGGNQAISNLLNLCDGLLSDCLNIQIVATFNTNINNIDSALMRKGRLIAKYEFKELEISKANMIAKELGFNKTYDQPISLADLYNPDDLEFDGKISKIGF